MPYLALLLLCGMLFCFLFSLFSACSLNFIDRVSLKETGSSELNFEISLEIGLLKFERKFYTNFDTLWFLWRVIICTLGLCILAEHLNWSIARSFFLFLVWGKADRFIEGSNWLSYTKLKLPSGKQIDNSIIDLESASFESDIFWIALNSRFLLGCLTILCLFLILKYFLISTSSLML